MNKQPSSQRKAVFALIILVMIWGYNWVVMKVAVQYSSSFDFAALRVLLGTISLLAAAISLRKSLLPGRLCRRPWFDRACPERTVRPFESLRANGESKDSPRTEDALLEINPLTVRPELVEGRTANDNTAPGGEIFWIFLTGLLQTGGFYFFSTWALVSGGAGKTAVLSYAMPFWVLLLAWVWLGERVRRAQWTGIVMAFAGLLFILMPFRFTEGLFSKVLALLSGFSWAAGIIVAKRLQQRTEMDLLSFTTWQMLFGSIPLILAALLIPSQPIRWSVPFISALAYSGILAGTIAWLLWFYALSRLTAGVAGLGTLGAPVVGVLTGWIQLGEIPGGPEIIGIVLIIGALVLNSIRAIRHT